MKFNDLISASQPQNHSRDWPTTLYLPSQHEPLAWRAPYLPAQTPDSSPTATPAPRTTDRSVANRWTERLATRWTPISEYFLANYSRLALQPGARGLNSTEAMLVIQLMSYKWTERAPWPTTGALAKRMGIGKRQVRASLQRLEEDGLLRRELSATGGPTKYRLEPLFEALEAMMEQDAEASEDSEVAA